MILELKAGLGYEVRRGKTQSPFDVPASRGPGNTTRGL